MRFISLEKGNYTEEEILKNLESFKQKKNKEKNIKKNLVSEDNFFNITSTNCLDSSNKMKLDEGNQLNNMDCMFYDENKIRESTHNNFSDNQILNDKIKKRLEFIKSFEKTNSKITEKKNTEKMFSLYKERISHHYQPKSVNYKSSYSQNFQHNQNYENDKDKKLNNKLKNNFSDFIMFSQKALENKSKSLGNINFDRLFLFVLFLFVFEKRITK